MINQIDIASFGSFQGLDWNKTVRDSGKNFRPFQRLNILYGRNYSGKTTLSRIFRALETRKLPLNYVGSSFTVTGDKGTVTHAGLLTHNYDVRVYNRDFVTDNLNFLVNQDVGGAIKTFAIVGEQNKEIDDAIAVIETKLGSVEGKAGLRFDLEAKRKERDRTKSAHTTASNGLDEKLRTHAADKIKKNRQYGSAVYNIDHIRRDIASTKKPGFAALATEEQVGKLTLLKQEALPDITGALAITLKLESLTATAEPLLSKVITPTKAIEELLKDSALQLWVKHGMGHHREKRDTCAFCRQDLPHDIWQVLDEHLSKESGDLFFKYPHHDDKNDAFERITKFFGNEEDTAVALVNRLNNEFSHLEAVPDRSFKPVEIPEIAKVANYVLDKIYASDKVQYNALLKSIGEPERTR